MTLSSDDLLTTTRAVRKRLDLDKPVERAVVEECLDLALQAPNGSNLQGWQWVIVDDRDQIAALARIYREAIEAYSKEYDTDALRMGASATPGFDRLTESATYLAENLQRVPVLVVPCINGRMEGAGIFHQASQWGSVLPAAWSFMLALRSRGLGSAWTTVHLNREKQAADVLGIPYERYTQAGLFPVAYTLGTEFKRAARQPSSSVTHWNRW
ncbi:MAG: nitroreductase family protein [Deltaproteobacteria bacterium]|nr:nitroreductase family protein [Deltaproteobacteria bacterium]MBW2359382.1 nitroreductase family protein [Deltaproteobacteria bacterium]